MLDVLNRGMGLETESEKTKYSQRAIDRSEGTEQITDIHQIVRTLRTSTNTKENPGCPYLTIQKSALHISTIIHKRTHKKVVP